MQIVYIISCIFIAVVLTSCEGEKGECYGPACCGNGNIDFGEFCDGHNLDGATCESFELGGGQLACDGSCGFDDSRCDLRFGVCGNGVVDERPDFWWGYELCDHDDLDNQTCESLGFQGGTLACHLSCSFEYSGCFGPPSCGNGIIDHIVEECDGEVPAEITCVSLGYDIGSVSCSNACIIDTSACV